MCESARANCRISRRGLYLDGYPHLRSLVLSFREKGQQLLYNTVPMRGHPGSIRYRDRQAAESGHTVTLMYPDTTKFILNPHDDSSLLLPTVVRTSMRSSRAKSRHARLQLQVLKLCSGCEAKLRAAISEGHLLRVPTSWATTARQATGSQRSLLVQRHFSHMITVCGGGAPTPHRKYHGSPPHRDCQ